MTTTVGSNYRSELLREVDQAGEARGEANAVLIVLDGRGVAVPEDVRERILACTDLHQLDTWLRRAGTATTVEDIIQP